MSRCHRARTGRVTMFLLGLVLLTGQVIAAPRVSVTLQPLQHLAAALTGGAGAIDLLSEGDQDPHHLTLRPSQRRQLARADLVIWLGPSMELPFADLMPQLDARVLTLSTLPGLNLIGAGDDIDPHLWLDPANVRVIARAITGELVRLDAAEAARYEANLDRFLQALDASEAEIVDSLAHKAIRAWAVDHHAYRYFARRFDLPAAIALQDSDNREPGLRSTLAFARAMDAAGLACIVVEPGENPARLRALLDRPDLAVMEADLLGLGLPASADSFIRLLEDVAATIEDCARGAHD